MHPGHIVRSMMDFSTEVAALCAPLNSIGVTMFSALINYADGTQVNLSNKSQWLHDYYSLKLFESSLFDSEPSQYNTGYYLWPSQSNLPIFRHGLLQFDSAYGVTICHRKKEYTAFYFFSGSSKNPGLMQFFINHMDFLERFICHFMNQGKVVIAQAKLLQMKRRVKTDKSPISDSAIAHLLEKNNALEEKRLQLECMLTPSINAFHNLGLSMSRRQK